MLPFDCDGIFSVQLVIDNYTTNPFTVSFPEET